MEYLFFDIPHRLRFWFMRLLPLFPTFYVHFKSSIPIPKNWFY